MKSRLKKKRSYLRGYVLPLPSKQIKHCFEEVYSRYQIKPYPWCLSCLQNWTLYKNSEIGFHCNVCYTKHKPRKCRKFRKLLPAWRRNWIPAFHFKIIWIERRFIWVPKLWKRTTFASFTFISKSSPSPSPINLSWPHRNKTTYPIVLEWKKPWLAHVVEEVVRAGEQQVDLTAV